MDYINLFTVSMSKWYKMPFQAVLGYIDLHYNMSYGATVGASAANSNLIEFKK